MKHTNTCATIILYESRSVVSKVACAKQSIRVQKETIFGTINE